MKRVAEVLDCWFESGSMPYAQFHFPFENKKEFKESFPAEFIAEGIDQTRGWFYTLMVLATALFNKPAYLNCIANGIVLAEDGKKLSKKLGNYTEPDEMFNKYSADVVRYYLITSPVMKGEDLRFSEKDVLELQRNVFMLLDNVLSFYKMVVGKQGQPPPTPPLSKGGKKEENPLSKEGENVKDIPSSLPLITKGREPTHVLDKWILAKLNELIKEVTKQMDDYQLIKASVPFEKFINELSTWYLRRSRERFKQGDVSGVATLGYVLLTLSKLMAPFTPFTAEYLYREVGGKMESVHLEEWPVANQKSKVKSQKSVLENMEEVRKIVEMGLAARAEAKIKVRQPLNKLTICGERLADEYVELIKDELNVKEVEFVIEELTEIKLDTTVTDELKQEGIARELIRHINSLRKKQGLTINDKVVIYHDGKLKDIFKKFGEEIKKATAADAIEQGSTKEMVEIDGKEVGLEIKRL
jgi:isoleucyl-tRNA synthetase